MTECEKKYEAIIADLGLTGPRVTSAMIKAVLDGVTYSTHVIRGTTTTLAMAVTASGFPLCTVAHVWASPADFNPALSIEIAITKAKGQAWDRIRDLEEYRLFQALHEAREDNATQALEQIRAVLSRGGAVVSSDRSISAQTFEESKAAVLAALPAVQAIAGGAGRELGKGVASLMASRAESAGTTACPLWRSCNPVDGVCTCQAGKACT